MKSPRYLRLFSYSPSGSRSVLESDTSTDVSIRNEAYYAGAGKYTLGNSGKREWVWTGSEDKRR